MTKVPETNDIVGHIRSALALLKPLRMTLSGTRRSHHHNSARQRQQFQNYHRVVLQLTEELREYRNALILQEFAHGIDRRIIAQELNLSISTVCDVINRSLAK